MALGLTHPLTEYFLGGKGSRCIGLTTIPSSCANCLEIWEPQPPGTLWAVQACNGIALPLFILIPKSMMVKGELQELHAYITNIINPYM